MLESVAVEAPQPFRQVLGGTESGDTLEREGQDLSLGAGSFWLFREPISLCHPSIGTRGKCPVTAVETSPTLKADVVSSETGKFFYLPLKWQREMQAKLRTYTGCPGGGAIKPPPFLLHIAPPPPSPASQREPASGPVPPTQLGFRGETRVSEIRDQSLGHCFGLVFVFLFCQEQSPCARAR